MQNKFMALLIGFLFCAALTSCFSRPEIPGFTFRGKEAFSCGGRSFSVDVYLHDKTGLEFVLVPGSKFILGESAGSQVKQLFNEGHQRVVIVESFLICKTEATQEAWDRIGGTDERKHWGPNLPINGVSWIDVSNWCEKAGLRLPTQAEWEYAAQAGVKGVYSFGDDADMLDDYAWTFKNSGGIAHPVGQKLPNAFGLFDVHGNVNEWCEEPKLFWSPGNWTYSGPLGVSPLRMIRGGSFKTNLLFMQTAFPGADEGEIRNYTNGFRPACSIR